MAAGGYESGTERSVDGAENVDRRKQVKTFAVCQATMKSLLYHLQLWLHDKQCELIASDLSAAQAQQTLSDAVFCDEDDDCNLFVITNVFIFPFFSDRISRTNARVQSIPESARSIQQSPIHARRPQCTFHHIQQERNSLETHKTAKKLTRHTRPTTVRDKNTYRTKKYISYKNTYRGISLTRLYHISPLLSICRY